MAAVLGERLNARIHPDWAAEQERGVRAACADADLAVTVAVEETDVLGFVAVIINSADASGEIDMIAVDPAMQRRGVGGALTAHALEQLRAAGCTLAVVPPAATPVTLRHEGLYEAARFTYLPLVRHYRTITTPENRPNDPAN